MSLGMLNFIYTLDGGNFVYVHKWGGVLFQVADLIPPLLPALNSCYLTCVKTT